MSGHIATVFGCTGFLGRYVVAKLAKQGTQVVVPYRDEDEKRPLKVSGDLGQIVSLEFDLRNRDQIAAAVRHSDVVYNLIGRDYETKNFTFESVHIEGAKRIAKLCAEHGVSRLIHVSALNAEENSTSRFYRTKARGEKAVKEVFPDATIVRPAVMHGLEDRFLNRMAVLEGNQLLIRNGITRIRPVHVLDVAYALELIMEDDRSPGETYELYGPNEYTYAQVSDMVTEMIMRPKRRINVPKPIALGVSKLLGYLPWPYISPDEIERMSIDSKITSGVNTFADLNIVPRRLDATMLQVVRRYRKSSVFDEPPTDPRRPKGAHIVY